MIYFIKTLREEEQSLGNTIFNGAYTRLRPIAMTALVAAIGFLPMALSASTGAQVQGPLVTLVIAGIISSTMLTLLILPVLYQLIYRKHSQT